MKKTILTFGFIAGAILAATMLATVPFMEKIGDRSAMLIGYTSMVLAFLLVYFGVRSYRENLGGGAITFGRALRVGISIAAIGCCCYVATWEVINYTLMPDFADKYAAHQLEQARASGASEAALAKKKKELDDFKQMYRNPVANVAMTFLEPLPVGVLMALLAAALLRRQKKAESPAIA